MRRTAGEDGGKDGFLEITMEEGLKKFKKKKNTCGDNKLDLKTILERFKDSPNTGG